jgi:DNA-binding transcriptional MerR regulator
MAPDGNPGVATLSPAAVQPLFPIRVVARLTGINPVTIRAWERRYGLVTPERTPGGHRLYSRADVDRLRSASRLISQGLAIGQASRLLDAERAAPPSRPSHAIERFLGRVARLDDEGMTALYQALRVREDGGAAAGALLAAIPATLEEAPVVQRRFAEAWVQALLGARVQASLPDEEAARVIVCVEADGPERTWGTVLALLLSELGLRPILLGPLPGESLEEAAERAGCTAVVVVGSGELPAAGRIPFFRGPFGEPAADAVVLEPDLRVAARHVADCALLAGDAA